jgi:predicted lipoprotein with Yx(FWY)xxD motif
MRKSGWAAAAGLVSVALLLTACGGSSSSSATGGSTPSTSAAATAAGNSAGSGSGSTPNPKASDNGMTPPPPGALYFDVQKTAKGYLLAEAKNGDIVYTYTADSAGKAPTCQGSCAMAWPAIKGVGLVSPADKLPGTFGSVDGYITYNGLPLYIFAGETMFADHAGGSWKAIQLSKSDILP